MYSRLIAETGDPTVAPLFEGIPLTGGEWSLTGIIFLIVMLILWGKLKPVSDVRSVERQRDHWQQTAMTNIATVATQADTIKLQAEAIKVQTEAAEFSRKVMEAIQQTAGGMSRDVL